MRTNRNRYKEMERSTTLVLLGDLLLFIFYLIAAANGITWLKVILFILTFFLSALCLLFLYYAGEIRRQRSFWMTTGFAAIGICVLFALILNYPSPNPYKNAAPAATTAEATTEAASEVVTESAAESVAQSN